MSMEFTPETVFQWDDEKRKTNLEKHGIDFEDAVFWLQEPRFEYPSDRYGEMRTIAICPEKDRLIAIVYTAREDICRIISVRVARHNERKQYHARYTQRTL